MGGFVELQLKDTSQENIDNQNDVLAELGLEEPYRFYSERDVQLEYEYFVKNEGTFPEHLFPRGEIKSYEDFKQYWSTEALGATFVPPYGALTFDCYFGRTDEDVMHKVGKYLLDNLPLLEECDSSSYKTFVERSGLDTEDQKKVLELYSEFEPELLPKKERTKKDLQSGLWLCKSWSPSPFWVIYGNVGSPRFMKDRKYVNDLYNSLYSDKKGYGYLLMPLMPLDAGSEWFAKVYEKAYQMGLRESPYFILPVLYRTTTSNTDVCVKDFKKVYTKEELLKRFELIFQNTASIYKYNQIGGFAFRGGKEFVPVGGTSSVVESSCQLLNILYKALDNDIVFVDRIIEKYGQL